MKLTLEIETAVNSSPGDYSLVSYVATGEDVCYRGTVIVPKHGDTYAAVIDDIFNMIKTEGVG